MPVKGTEGGSLELSTTDSLEVTLLGLLEVDDVPDGVEVLKKGL